MKHALLLLATLGANSAFAWDGLAVLGDSLSTGAASHPALTFDSHELWNVVTGKTSVVADLKDVPNLEQFKITTDIKAPNRLWPSNRENDGGSGWVWLHTLQAFSRAALDTEEYSFGYLFGRSLGFSGENIWIAGDNGTRSEHALIHAARVLDAADGELPSHILMLYTGNDLCAPNWEGMTASAAYGEGLKQAILYFARNGRNSGGKTSTLYLPAFLPVTTLISEESIANKTIRFYGSDISCSEAKKRMFSAPESVESRPIINDWRFAFFAQLMPPNPVLLCPTLFSKAASETANQSLLANRIRAYRDVQKSVVEEVTKEIAENVRLAKIDVRYIAATENVLFEGDDVAADCFHLGPKGHAKIAKTLIQGL